MKAILKLHVHLLLLVFGFVLPGVSIAGEILPVVTLTEVDVSAAEAGQDTGEITISRSDDGNTAAALRVYLEIGGSAVPGGDYSTTNLSWAGGATYHLTIPATALSQSVTLTPLRDNLIEDVEDITFVLAEPQLAGHDYTIGSPSGGGVTISDDVAEVTFTLNDGEAAEAGPDTASFTVTRDTHGNTAAALRVYLEIGGSAVPGGDYSTTNLSWAGGATYHLTIPATALSQSVTLTPIFDETEEGDETAVFNLLGPQLAGSDYTVGLPSKGEITIQDFVDIIFRDGFE